jgi:hypothetical protein
MQLPINLSGRSWRGEMARRQWGDLCHGLIRDHERQRPAKASAMDFDDVSL